MRREWSDEGGADFFKASGASKGVGRKLFRAAKLLRSILYVFLWFLGIIEQNAAHWVPIGVL